MHRPFIYDIKTFIEDLENLYKQPYSTYIFRGHAHSSFLLQPTAFRPTGINRLAKHFPMTQYFSQWCSSPKIKKLIREHQIDEQIYFIQIKRFLELTFYLMQYNHSLAQDVQKRPHLFDARTIEMYQLRQPCFWTKEGTFEYLLNMGLTFAITIKDLKGNILKEGHIEETIPGYDDSLPQHYGIPTAALDWTRNPFVALYFALDKVPPDAQYISLLMLKTFPQSNLNPIRLEEGKEGCNNLRIMRQEGLFTRMQYACRFFMEHGRWPCIEDYRQIMSSHFELTKHYIPVHFINDLRCLILQKGITEEFLFPDKEEETICE